VCFEGTLWDASFTCQAALLYILFSFKFSMVNLIELISSTVLLDHPVLFFIEIPCDIPAFART